MLDLKVADMLPDLELRAAAGGASVPLRSPTTETTVVFRLHPFSCAGCSQYLRELARMESEFRIWDARLLVVIRSSAGAIPDMPFGKLVLSEHEPTQAGLIVADRYGQIFYLVQSSNHHNLPAPRELEEWLKHLGTLCPE